MKSVDAHFMPMVEQVSAGILLFLGRAGQRTERRGATTPVQLIAPPPPLENSTDFGHFKNASQGITRKNTLLFCTVLRDIYMDIAHC